MGSIEKYRRPETAGELLEVARAFLQAEFGFQVWGRTVDGMGAGGITVDLAVDGAENEVWLVVGEEGRGALDDQAEDETKGTHNVGPPGGGPNPPACVPLDGLIRAALADYRERLRTDFRPQLSTGCHIPLGDIATHRAKYDALSSVMAILHHLVVAAHGGGWDDIANGVQAVEVDGALIVVDEADGLEAGFPIHVVELANVVRIGGRTASHE